VRELENSVSAPVPNLAGADPRSREPVSHNPWRLGVMTSTYHHIRQVSIFAVLTVVMLGAVALKLGYPFEMVISQPLDVLHAIFVAPRSN
jgi:hypothetical protein